MNNNRSRRWHKRRAYHDMVRRQCQIDYMANNVNVPVANMLAGKITAANEAIRELLREGS